MLSEVIKTLGPEGRFAQICDGYEYREEQLEMAAAIAETLCAKEHILVEAGTGVGKTVAYLTPAVLCSAGGKPTIISTHTINLQSQLINKDIPMMREVMSEHPFTAVLMKGRSNYVCLQEIDHASYNVTMAGDLLFEKLKDWVETTQTGDVQEMGFVFPDWNEVCCNPDTCRRQECPYYLERCFYYRMRRQAEAADIVVVNHSLFFSDLSLKMLDPRSGILPDYDVVIFDEAHHLEDVAGDIFGIEFSNYRVNSILNRLKKRRDIAISQGEYQLIEGANASLFEAFATMRRSEFFFDEMYEKVERAQVETAAGELVTLLDGLAAQLQDQDTEGNPELKDRIDGYRRMVLRMRDELTEIFASSDPNYFKWCEKPTGSRFVNCFLHLTPVNVASILRNALWDTKNSGVCVSATLSTSGSFDYYRSRVGLTECEGKILGSPFDFKTQALLYVPDDLDTPSEKPEYADAVAARISTILDQTQGRAFILFTSYRMLNCVFERIVEHVPYRLLRQGEMSNERLIKEFRSDDRACLMGVHSFWEGVDVKGERLSCVIIDKLPFAVPDNPTHKARCEEIERDGGDWFRGYAMPQAQIRLKQGFGRLIRTKSDRGVVAILDSRIHSRSYGKEFLRHLPRCKGTTSVEKIGEFLRE